MNKHRRGVLRFALYIDRIGAVPTVYQGQSLAAYAVDLQQQYEALRQDLGPEASASARTAGRELIRTKGFPEIQKMLESAGLLSLGNLQSSRLHESASAITDAASPATESERLLRRAADNCRRKLRHVDFLSALLHARRLKDEYLNIYPCPICLGLHVGHRQDAEARRRRFVVEELELLDRRIREIQRDQVALLNRRNRLSAELETMEPTGLA